MDPRRAIAEEGGEGHPEQLLSLPRTIPELAPNFLTHNVEAFRRSYFARERHQRDTREHIPHHQSDHPLFPDDPRHDEHPDEHTRMLHRAMPAEREGHDGVVSEGLREHVAHLLDATRIDGDDFCRAVSA